METKVLVQSLKKEVETNQVLKDVLYLFAIRKRSHNTMRLKNLFRRMKAEGFSHTKGQYGEALRLLASMGVGTLKVSGKNVIGLVDIAYGMAFLGTSVIGVVPHTARTQILPSEAKKPEVKVGAKVKKPHPLKSKELQVEPKLSLTVDIRGKKMRIDIPSDFTSEEIKALIDKF